MTTKQKTKALNTQFDLDIRRKKLDLALLGVKPRTAPRVLSMPSADVRSLLAALDKALAGSPVTTKRSYSPGALQRELKQLDTMIARDRRVLTALTINAMERLGYFGGDAA